MRRYKTNLYEIYIEKEDRWGGGVLAAAKARYKLTFFGNIHCDMCAGTECHQNVHSTVPVKSKALDKNANKDKK